MVYDANKYYLKFAWFPKVLTNGQRIWWERYYEATLRMPLSWANHVQATYMTYTKRRLSTVDYLVETLKGDIVEGVDKGFWRKKMKEINEELT